MAEQAWENVQGTKEKPDELLRAIAMGNERVKEENGTFWVGVRYRDGHCYASFMVS